MKKKLLSLVLCLVMVFSLFPAFGMNASALDTNAITNPSTAQDETGKLNLSKELSQNPDGTYDITLKSWATNTVETEIIPEQVPTDFVLVLDQSGSMATVDMPTGFSKVDQTNFSTQDILDAEADNDPYYFLAPNGKYYEVHERDAGTYSQLSDIYIYQQHGIAGWGTRKGLTRMSTPLVARTNETGEGDTTEAWYLYKGVYYKLSVYAVGLPGFFQGTPFFTDANGVRHYLKSYNYTWNFGTIGANPLITETIYERKSTAYRLHYLDESGNAVDVGNQVDNRSATAYSGDLYKKNDDESRLSALQKSVNSFIDTVANQKNADGSRVDHRIAIVGFASGNQRSGQTPIGRTSYYEVNEYGGTDIGKNTELFDGSTQKNYFTDNPQDEDYHAALKSTDQTGVQQLKASVNALEASGATFPNYGLQMAEHVFTSRGEDGTQYTKLDGVTKDQRNMIVVMFTDGVPGLNDYDNQFRAADYAVAEAKTLKDMDAEVYTVGVFSQDDTHPLQYSLKKYETDSSDSYAQTAAAQPNYLYSEMQKYTNGDYAYTYYMFRGNNTLEGNGTDTIGNYMRAVSSDYEDATAFMDSNTPDPSTGLSKRGTATSNNHYMRASDTKALEQVFKTIATSINHSGTPIAIDSTSVLQDVVDLDCFAFTDASDVVAYSVLGTTTDDENYSFGTAVKEELDPSWDQTTGSITVDGFDYSTQYISSMNGENGRQLIVKITNLIPTDSGDALTSNEGNAKITVEKDEETVDVVSIDSPAISVSNRTYVIDFNAPMKVAEDAYQLTAAKDNTNGAFAKSKDEGPFYVTYQLDSENQLSAKGATKQINKAYTSVDSAMMYGKAYDPKAKTFAPDPAWNKITTIPAGSVYYDDNLANGNDITVGDGSGYNVSVIASPATSNADAGQYSFTFYGSGIDIYCTTANDGGYIQAKLTKNGAAVADYPNQTVKNYSQTERYNVPSISFTGLEPGEYTVTLNILGSSNYKLDGIRVYNPADSSTYDGQDTHEQYASYINMREALVNDNGNSQAFSDNMSEAVLGALFVDDTDSLKQLVTATEEQIAAGDGITYYDAEGNVVSADTDGAIAMISAYQNKFEAYRANSPKHEIYLDTNEAVIFQLTEAAETAATNGNLWIGLSAPDKDKDTGTVTLKEGETIDVTSCVDMYYPLTADMIGANRVVTLRNTGSNMISVTNLKITGNEAIYAASSGSAKAPTRSTAKAMLKASPAEDVIPMVFEPVTMRSVMVAANNGVDPDTVVEPGEPEDPTSVTPDPEPTVTPDPTPTPVVTPEPTPTPTPSSGNSFVKVVTNIVKSLLKSISRLFGR